MTNKQHYEEAESDPSCTSTGSKNTGMATKNSIRGRKMATDIGGVFNNPFYVGLKSAHAFNQVQQWPHLVPVPAMMIDDVVQGLGSVLNSNLPFNSASVIQGDSHLEVNDVPIDPVIEPGLSTIMHQPVISKLTARTALIWPLPTALMQDITGWHDETPTMLMAPQLAPGPLANPFNTLSFHDPSPLGKPPSMASSALTLQTGISSPTLVNAELTPQTSSMSPEVSHASSLVPQPSVLSFLLNTPASDKHIPPVAGCQSVLPHWLTDTVHHLESHVKHLQQKSDDTIDIVKSQALENLKLDQKQLQNDVDEALTSVESVKSNVEAITVNVNMLVDSYKTSGECLKANAACIVVQHSKDNMWNTHVRKCFLSAIGITKANMVKTYHPHKDGVQIKDNKIRPDFTKDWNDNACWGTPMINYIYEYRGANGISLMTGKARSKPNAQHVHREAQKRSISLCSCKQKLEEHTAVRGESQLGSTAWNYAFTLPYQSTDKSIKSADERVAIDPETDNDGPATWSMKLKGKHKATLKLPWVTWRPAYRDNLFNEAMDHLNDLVLQKKFGHHPHEIKLDCEKDLLDIKTGLKIPLGAIDSCWIQAHAAISESRRAPVP
ncbi:hypothetical protein PAXRUDRAFT_36775 [Paxillus rubicundulus Ve08.2h10]|uniref:Uncharacterized protein n=1 Tax=Paxillus rubicundulus Ve08.2h10 TaxID=930991 RepID=A0A0D0C314_9AGAM|nr:hypothetical protein PAXRUDRAFT_36775 [Paxillus rubicundulus Ve08.2h10]